MVMCRKQNNACTAGRQEDTVEVHKNVFIECSIRKANSEWGSIQTAPKKNILTMETIKTLPAIGTFSWSFNKKDKNFV